MNLHEIKERIKKLDNTFKDNFNVSQSIEQIIAKDETAKEILRHLKEIERANTSPFIQNYIDQIKQDLYEFEKIESEIEKTEYELKSLIEEVKDELIKRNINVEGIALRRLSYDKNDLQTQKEYLRELKLRHKYLNETRESIKKEKQVGEAFKEGFQEGEKTATNIKKVDEEAEKNIREIINPNIETVINYLNYYYNNRKSDSNVSLKIEREAGGSQRTLSITNFGTSVSEKEPKTIFYFNDCEYFDQVVLPTIIKVYASENIPEASIHESNSYQNIAESGDNLEINNMNEKAKETDELLKRKKGIQRVRKDKPYGISSIFFVVLISLITIVGTITFILLRS